MTAAVVEVTVLTKPDCALCDLAKEILRRVGADHPLRLVEIALDTPEGAALAVRARVLFAPGILLDGEPFAYGRLSERRLRRELTARATEVPVQKGN